MPDPNKNTPTAQHDARLFLLLAAAGVIGVTLYPLRLVDSADRYLAGLTGVFEHPVDLMSPVHLVPAAIMTLLAIRSWPRVHPWLLGVSVLVGLLLLEASQPLIQYRHARLGDIAMQTAGVVVGVLLARRAVLSTTWVAHHARLIWATMSACSIASVLFFGLRAQVGHAIGPVDTSYRVTVGSEVGGVRDWQGTIQNIAAYAADLTATDAGNLAANPIEPGAITQRRERGPAMIYDFVNSGARIEGVVQVPDLGDTGATLFDRNAALTEQGLDTAQGGSVASRQNVGRFSVAAQQAGAIAIEATLTPLDTEQFGPARIITISNGVGVRNFTLSQLGDGLELRVRTARTGLNASRAPVKFDGVMQAGRRVHVVLVSTGDRASLYFNGELAAEQVLFVGPGAWLGLVPAWGDLPASFAFFAPLGIAAVGVIRRRVLGAVLAGGLAAAVVASVFVFASTNDRPIEPALLIMAVSVAVLAAVLASPQADQG